MILNQITRCISGVNNRDTFHQRLSSQVFTNLARYRCGFYQPRRLGSPSQFISYPADIICDQLTKQASGFAVIIERVIIRHTAPSNVSEILIAAESLLNNSAH